MTPGLPVAIFPAKGQTTIQIALLGNPNTGKTTLFNALSGLRHRTGNYPGVTVEVRKGTTSHGDVKLELLDLPGTYSLAGRSPDELLAIDIVTGRFGLAGRPDVLLCLADASNIERTLYLFSQALELGLPCVIALSMNDLAQKQGTRVDANRLSSHLGVTVIVINALKNYGIEALKEALVKAAHCPVPLFEPMLPGPIQIAREKLASSWDCHSALVLRALVDEGGEAERQISSRLGTRVLEELKTTRAELTSCHHIALAVMEPRARYPWIRSKLAGCVERFEGQENNFTERTDRWLVHPQWGTLIFLLVMMCLFQSIFVIAKPVMVFLSYLVNYLAGKIEEAMPLGSLSSLIVEGVIPGVGAVLVFLPQILILFAFLGILEDCGYMARAAFLMDRLMSRCGLSGKAFIPLLSSLGCAVPGILATRVIESRRDRLAAMLVAPLMSCSARLPVYILLTGAFLSQTWWLPGVIVFSLYLIGFIMAPLVAWVLRGTLLAGEKPIFLLEMPSFRWPSARTILRRMVEAAWDFLARAGSVILASMVMVWAMLQYPISAPDGRPWPEVVLEAPVNERGQLRAEWKSGTFLGLVSHTLDPVWKPLGWDWRIGAAALASFPAREVVVASLGIVFGQDPDSPDGGLPERLKSATREDGSPLFTVPVALSGLVFVSLCCQCVSTLAVMARETKSLTWPAFTFTYMTILAYVGAMAAYHIGMLFSESLVL